jgi:hypothetical protein
VIATALRGRRSEYSHVKALVRVDVDKCDGPGQLYRNPIRSRGARNHSRSVGNRRPRKVAALSSPQGASCFACNQTHIATHGFIDMGAFHAMPISTGTIGSTP